jgi:hypothetical protein
MGKIGLQIRANLENVTDLKPEGEDFRWYFKLKCTSCGDESQKWQYMSLEEKFPIKGSRGEASLVSKCKLCGRENSLDLIRESISSYTVDDNNRFKTVLILDCRGIEPVDFSPRSGYSVRGAESGTHFEDISLEEKEWVDYDEKTKESVAIYEFTHNFVKI